MSDWEYSPIENISYALQDIANILERIEKKMPVPEGIISTSTGPVDPNIEEPIDAEEAEDIAAFDAAMAELEEQELPEAE